MSKQAVIEMVSDLIVFYEIYCGGGDAHVVFDDENIDDRCIDWCLDHAKEPMAVDMLLQFKALSEDDREEVMELFWRPSESQ